MLAVAGAIFTNSFIVQSRQKIGFETVTSYPAPDQFERRVVLAGIVLLHAGVVAVLILSGVIAPEKLTRVLQATLILPSPPQPEPPRPRPPPPQPKPVPLPHAQSLPSPLLAAAVAAPSPISVSPATTAPLAVSAPPAPAASPLPITPPQFGADYLDNPKPAYPPISRRMREEGKVLMRVFVEADGRPGRVEIQSSSGSPRLDQAASSAVSRWKFIPARQGSDAVAAWVLVPIVFKLES